LVGLVPILPNPICFAGKACLANMQSVTVRDETLADWAEVAPLGEQPFQRLILF